ncbi:MAG: hypothetical protein ACO39C_08820, partial [Chthoniobacterales bacterium]
MPEDAPTLDLSALDFRPAWAKDPSSSPSPVAPEPRHPRHERSGSGPKRGFKPGGPRRGPKPGGKKFDRPPREEQRPAPPPPNPFPWLRIAFSATPAAVDTVVAQVRQTG